MDESSSTSSSTPPSRASTAPSSLPSPEIQTLSLGGVTDEDRAEAAKIKTKANQAFANATYWCNRAAARTKLEEYGFALSDASRAIEVDPKYAKAFYRRATCYLQIAKPQLAVADFKKVVALEPRNYYPTQKLVRRIEFEKAIEVEGEKNPVERCHEIIAEGGCEVEKTYAGPQLSTGNDGNYVMTEEFIKAMIEWFKAGKNLSRRYAWEIILGACSYFVKEESLVNLDLQEGVTCDVIGDVHGQFYDLLNLYSLTGTPTEKHCLLMNGDLVDRGSWSIEVILTAFAYKWLYPTRMFINRGNHEAKDMNRTYGFEGEAKHKHGEQTYKLFAHVFTTLPLATLVSATKAPTKTSTTTILSPQGLKRYFVVHGGLFSKDGPGQDGLMCAYLFLFQLLWTDPQTQPGRGPSKRGVGIAFGPDVTKRWCSLNGITSIIRSHEVRQDGYAVEHDGLCTTVFSAPNYVDQVGNKGAFIRIDAEGEQKYFQFEATPHPPMKPMAYAQGGLASLMM
ncbi:phosphoprotein phosphatase [Suillus subluteus]|nr:phosphoprotein phosphatase [Suillus subluteus]